MPKGQKFVQDKFDKKPYSDPSPKGSGLIAKKDWLIVHNQYRIEIKKGEKTVNGKSIMGVMMLAANQGTSLELVICGEDEAAMVKDIECLVNNKFGEED